VPEPWGLRGLARINTGVLGVVGPPFEEEIFDASVENVILILGTLHCAGRSLVDSEGPVSVQTSRINYMDNKIVKYDA
jgi:hypothetical protein